MIRRMREADIPAGMVLKQAAGWNQTEQDWENILALEPEGCWVYEADGKVAGAATTVCYGVELAWIGMVLTLPDYRRRGIARALMEEALRFCVSREVRCVKLDATDMGRPLYAKLGFEDELLIERWGITLPDRAGAGNPPDEPPRLEDVSRIAALDRRAFGADRRAILQRLAGRFPDECWALPGAYLMARPGSKAYFLGPCVAEDNEAARRLIEALLRRHPGESFFWDLLPDNPAATALAQSLGFEHKRTLIRMVWNQPGRGTGKVGDRPDLVVAAAGFEYG